MKRKIIATLLLFGLMTGWMLQPAMAKKGKGGGKPAPVPVLTDAEASDLLFMREEEKLARDVYITMYAEWGTSVFANISPSEQKHMDSILGLLDTYGLADPSLGFGEFADEELQKLFDDLIALGRPSELDRPS